MLFRKMIIRKANVMLFFMENALFLHLLISLVADTAITRFKNLLMFAYEI